MKIRTSKLSGPWLNYAVGLAEGYPEKHGWSVLCVNKVRAWVNRKTGSAPCEFDERILNYCTDPAQAWPIIDREHIRIQPTLTEGGYRTSASVDAVKAQIELPNGATVYEGKNVITEYGNTALIAAMRCYVAAKLGDEIEVPFNE